MVPPAALRARAIEALLVEKGVITQEAVARGIDWLVSRTPLNGARIVARAWTDEGSSIIRASFSRSGLARSISALE